jgi:hypothetical protein
VPLPDRLEGVSFNVGAFKDLTKEFGPGWSVMGMLRPGFFADSTHFSGKSFNLSAMLSVGRKVSPDFSWNLGVGASLRSQNKVLPVSGVRWNFAPDWTLAVGFPRTGVTYKVSEALRLNAGLMFQGGSYYVATARGPGLGNTYLEYREFRVGSGIDWKIEKNLSVSLDAGAAVSRKFNYYDRSYQLDGKSVGFATVAAHFRF